MTVYEFLKLPVPLQQRVYRWQKGLPKGSLEVLAFPKGAPRFEIGVPDPRHEDNTVTILPIMPSGERITWDGAGAGAACCSDPAPAPSTSTKGEARA